MDPDCGANITKAYLGVISGRYLGLYYTSNGDASRIQAKGKLN